MIYCQCKKLDCGNLATQNDWESNRPSSRDVLTIQDPERFLEGFDLFFPSCNTVLVAYACINAGRLEFLVIRKSSIKLLLCAVQVSLLLLKSLLLVLLLPRLVLDVLCLLRLVD